MACIDGLYQGIVLVRGRDGNLDIEYYLQDEKNKFYRDVAINGQITLDKGKVKIIDSFWKNNPQFRWDIEIAGNRMIEDYID